MFIGNKNIKPYIGNKWLKAVYKGATLIYRRAVDTPITLLKSSYSSNETIYPYNVNATIYKDIDLALYKGVQFYVKGASIGANHHGGHTYINVAAYDDSDNNQIGKAQIASGYCNYQGEQTRSSEKGKTLQFEFTKNKGTATLKVVGTGDGTNCTGTNWSLSDVILLAR